MPGCLTIRHPAGRVAPVVFSSPHSGRDYAAGLLAATRLDELSVRRSEDCYVDDLFAGAPEAGVALVAAVFPRAWCDVNREAWELDPGMFEDALPDWVNTASARVSAGLGTLARVVASGEAIYGRRLRFAEARQRVAACWHPYHDALAALVGARVGAFGRCLLVDCHSMPGHACQDRRPVPDIVLGDAHGAACGAAVLLAAERHLAGAGYVVRRNDPYAGGYITRHYGRPAQGVHALQIEIARGLYMEEASLRLLPGFARVQADMSALAARLAERAEELMG